VKIRLVLADDHPIVLHGLQQLFERQADFAVIRCCTDGHSTLEAVRTLRPDVLVLDLRMPNGDGSDVLRHIAAEELGCRTVVLTAAIRNRQALDALQNGALGLVLKESAPETLVTAVRRVHQGERWIDPEILTGALGGLFTRDRTSRQMAGQFTPRETEIIGLIVEGLRNREIAERLSISEGTVKLHLHHIYEKADVDGRLALVLYAQQHGLT
jgi:DNA-binding NarL/FixJ family response regulator